MKYEISVTEYHIRHFADGELHAEHCPAQRTYLNRQQWWYWHGQLHRLNGPAVSYRLLDHCGDIHSWYLHGRRYSEDLYWKAVKDLQCKL